uniref:SAP domain-containing protein n=1 Tax=Arundo donax TaxID=35708 RepID=A0A0A8YHZ8_ARUDO
MGYQESKKHLLSLSYTELQCLCKRYNLPANKTHPQLASSLASLLEASPSPLSSVKEASTGIRINLKRGPYHGRDDNIPLVHAKHQKGPPQTVVDESSKMGIDTSTSICPVSISYGRPDCHGRSSSEPGNAHNVQSQSAVGTVNKSTNPELANEQHGSPANIIDQTSAPVIHKHPVIDDGLVSTPFKRTEDAIDKGCGPSDMISANASRVQFFVMKDEGIDLVVDLDSTPSTWANNFKAEVNLCIPPDLELGNVSSFISSLVSKDDHSTILPSGNIAVDVHSKRAESIAPSTNSSLGSDAGDNSRAEPYPADRTTVNSVSSASTLPSTYVELSGYQEGAPVVSTSCLTADVQNNMTSDMMAGALDNEVLPTESVGILARSERITTALADASVQSIGYKDTTSPGKTKVSGKIGCTQTISVADTNSLSAFSSGDLVRSPSNEDSSPKSAGKQTVNVPGGAQFTHNGDTHEILMEPMEAVSMEKDTGSGDRLSISCQLARQTVAKLPVTDAQSDASSADHCIAGNFDLTNPTSSSAASDNAVNPLTSKCGAESAQSHGSADKSRECDPEELEELESKTPPAYGEPPRNILLSLRSASARQTKPSALRRRSPRLVPK